MVTDLVTAAGVPDPVVRTDRVSFQDPALLGDTVEVDKAVPTR